MPTPVLSLVSHMYPYISPHLSSHLSPHLSSHRYEEVEVRKKLEEREKREEKERREQKAEKDKGRALPKASENRKDSKKVLKVNINLTNN